MLDAGAVLFVDSTGVCFSAAVFRCVRPRRLCGRCHIPCAERDRQRHGKQPVPAKREDHHEPVGGYAMPRVRNTGDRQHMGDKKYLASLSRRLAECDRAANAE